MADLSWPLQRKLLRAPDIGFNAEVRRWFADLDSRADVGRTRLRDSLLIQAKDSRTSALFKIQYFREFVQKVHLKPEVFIDMTDRIYEDFNMRPQVNMLFYKSIYLENGKYDKFKVDLSYKLIQETSETITPTKNRVRAERIKRLFAEPTRFIWNKGRLKFTYLDVSNGYDFRILAISEAEARRIIEQVLDIENKNPDWDKFVTHTPERQLSTTRPTKRIYGENRKVPRWRPTVDLPFVRAEMKIHGIPTPIPLVDCISGIAIVKVPSL